VIGANGSRSFGSRTGKPHLNSGGIGERWRRPCSSVSCSLAKSRRRVTAVSVELLGNCSMRSPSCGDG
jgi:hypothetical protein